MGELLSPSPPLMPAQDKPNDDLRLFSDVIEELGEGDDPKLKLEELVAAFGERGFGAMILILSMLAALQAPVIMMSQNRHAAKDRQGFIEGRIQEIESKLSMSQVIDPSSLDADGKVVFGSTVVLQDQASAEEVTYQIVGEDEADLKLGLINVSSPIARALIGKEDGDMAVVQAPGGEKRYEIVSVSYR
jgi:transcription elongation GreA/GreB family factor